MGNKGLKKGLALGQKQTSHESISATSLSEDE
jgi:hypothetical protein